MKHFAILIIYIHDIIIIFFVCFFSIRNWSHLVNRLEKFTLFFVQKNKPLWLSLCKYVTTWHFVTCRVTGSHSPIRQRKHILIPTKDEYIGTSNHRTYNVNVDWFFWRFLQYHRCYRTVPLRVTVQSGCWNTKILGNEFWWYHTKNMIVIIDNLFITIYYV